MTGRLPFDPERIAGPPPDLPPAHREKRYAKVSDARPLTVSELSNLIRRTLEERIASPIQVIGEISNLNTREHWYFSLKDDEAVLPCVAWASNARRFKFTPADGQEVIARGHVSHYPVQGRTQFYVTGMKPVGAGGLDQRFRELCEELRREGWFDDVRKRPLPPFPRRIAIITSATGAALQDVIRTARDRWPAVALLVFDARVQGEGAASSIVAAIERANQLARARAIDAVLVTRGGGSIEDLWAFNEREVGFAILQSALPVVAAIGHESDTTVAELVADVRASTPTQAVMRLIPEATDLARQLEHLAHRALMVLSQRLTHGLNRIDAIARHEILARPVSLVVRARERQVTLARSMHREMVQSLAGRRLQIERSAGRLNALAPRQLHARRAERSAVLAERLRCVMHARLRESRQRLDARNRMLDAVELRRVLRRGYTYTVLADGRFLRSIRDVADGDQLETHVADGTIRSTVGRARRRPTRPAAPGKDQLDLFNPPD